MRAILRSALVASAFFLGSCAGMSSQDIGRIIGGVGGAVVGDHLGGTLGAVVGGIIGYVVGGHVGSSMDRADKERAARELDRELRHSAHTPNHPYRPTPRDAWRNGDREYEVYTRTFPSDRPHCQRYEQDVQVTIRGRLTTARKEGVACWNGRERAWEIVE